jgi:4'-phosphopantetheinyl transferase
LTRLHKTVSVNSARMRARPRIAGNDVHVWLAKLEQPDQYVLRFASILSNEEQIWSAGFRLKRYRKRFIVARGVLRAILGFYLNSEPDRIEFCYSPYGKPYLTEGYYKEPIQFSSAHSHELALYALTLSRRVGVDLELVRKIPYVEQMAAQSFSPLESAAFRMSPKSRKLKVFFDFWTRKEAYGKAIGTGLMDLAPEEPTCEINTDRDGTRGWSLKSFTPASGYTAALAIEGHDYHIHHFQFLPQEFARV